MKAPQKKLENNSTLFMQLGLVLALLFVYSVLEIKTEVKDLHTLAEATTDPDLNPDIQVGAIIIEKPKPIEVIDKKPKSKKVVIDISKVKTTDDEITSEPNLEDLIDDEPIIDITNTINNLPDITDEEGDDEVIFINLEQAPIFPGCEGLEGEESKKCFSKKISKFVGKKFNTDIASNNNLYGKQKIFVQFTIDKNGNVNNIKTRAPHKSLEKEASRVIKSLPKMTPGKQRQKAVSVKYTLPIKFNVQN